MPKLDKRSQADERRVADEGVRVRPERVAPPIARRPRRLVRWLEWMIVVLVIALGAAGIAILLGGEEEAAATPYNLATNMRETGVVVPEPVAAPSNLATNLREAGVVVPEPVTAPYNLATQIREANVE